MLTFVNAPDYESPGDSDADNSYSLTINVSDGTNTTTQAITVSVTDVTETAVQANADNASVDEDGQISINPLSNDIIVTAGFPISLSTSSPSNGSVEINNDNSLKDILNNDWFNERVNNAVDNAEWKICKKNCGICK